MNLKEAASYLGLPRPLDRLILLRNPPLIEPLVSLEQEKLNPTFSRPALDLFRARLFRAANPSPAGINLPDIRFAAKRLNCSVLEIVDLILEGKVHPYRTGDDEDFASLLVDPETVRPYIHSVEKPGLTARDVEKRLRTNTATVRALLANGRLPVTMQRHPVQRGLQPFIPFDAVETFEDRYISLFNLARETGIHFLKVKSLIDQCGIEPSFNGSEIPTTFYPRSAALHALSGALASQAEPVGRR